MDSQCQCRELLTILKRSFGEGYPCVRQFGEKEKGSEFKKSGEIAGGRKWGGTVTVQSSRNLEGS